MSPTLNEREAFSKGNVAPMPASADAPSGRGRAILHLDLDAFYASVEIRDDPSLAGKAVIVGADPQAGKGRGVVVTASYEARKFGVRSAMPVSQAWRLCPHATWVPPRHERYGEASRHVMELLAIDGALVEPASIDEAFLDVTGRVQSFDEAVALAQALKKRIFAAEGLTVSVGVAANKLVAKVASDARKPDGLTVVRPGSEGAFLAPLPVRKIPGVGPKTDEALAAAGLHTCGEVAGASLELLRSIVGSWAAPLKFHAGGFDDAPVLADWERKSLGSETTFDHDIDDRAEILGAIDSLSKDVTSSLSGEGLMARTVHVKIRTENFTTFTRARTLPGPSADEGSIRAVARQLFVDNDPGVPIRLIGVRLTNLVGGGQATLERWKADILGEAEPWQPPWRF
ncbi:MAG: DNA polymerase IV [Thermoplasmatota archaeon]